MPTLTDGLFAFGLALIVSLLTTPIAGALAWRIGAIDRHVAGKEDLSRQLWGLLAFTLWHERHVEREPVALRGERLEALVR